jgi:NAD-dependent deacetylase
MTINEFTDEFVQQAESKKITVFTGAGMSTPSGIRDFRGENGLYKQNVNAERILSRSYFDKSPLEFYKFYREFLLMKDSIQPNDAHYFIKELQDKGYINGIITQNIDGLDTKAGCKNVIEIHGNAHNFYCVHCKKKYTMDDIINMDTIPICPSCNSIIRPDIVLYQEQLEQSKVWDAKAKVASANTLFVVGSSLKVNPASSIVHDFLAESRIKKSKKVFIVNKGPTDFDGYRTISKYDGDIIDVVKELKQKI